MANNIQWSRKMHAESKKRGDCLVAYGLESTKSRVTVFTHLSKSKAIQLLHLISILRSNGIANVHQAAQQMWKEEREMSQAMPKAKNRQDRRRKDVE